MKRVLVITDNEVQYGGIRNVFDEMGSSELVVTYRHSHLKSAIWQHEDFSDIKCALNAKENVSWLIESFDLIISVHCKQLFPQRLVESVRCINIHPGYNPINRGWYPQVFAIINENKVGATIHEMDVKLDHGPIIAREFVEQFDYDTSLDVYKRVCEKEIKLFKDNFSKIINNTYTTYDNIEEGELYLKKDFNALCELDLEKRVSYKEAINRLRALTHGTYKNAFFRNQDGKKVFISIAFELDGE